MARRGSSGAGVMLILGGVIVAGGLGFAGYALSGNWSEPYRTTEPLDPADYRERNNGLVGNTYRVRGQIDLLLASDDSGHRLFSVLSEEEDEASQPVPLLITPKHQGDTFQKGQTFSFKVLVREGGILEVEEWTR